MMLFWTVARILQDSYYGVWGGCWDIEERWMLEISGWLLGVAMQLLG